MTNAQTVALRYLVIDPMNVRRTDKKPDPAMISSIEAEGIIEALLVRNGSNGKILAYNGGRRILALQILREAKRHAGGLLVNDDFPVPVVVDNVDDKRAREISLTVAIHRQDLHPVDRFEAFSEMVEAGETEQSIAVRHGLTARAVRQALALGKLDSMVRAAWRDKLVDAKTAQAFTMAEPDVQKRVFNKLHKNKQLYEHNVLEELKVDDDDIGRMAAFIGDAVYVAAGGKMTRDLFSATRAIVSDPVLLKELTHKKLADECTRLVEAEGWKWALIKPENYFDHDRDRLAPKYTPEEKARVVEIEAAVTKMDEDEGAEYDFDLQENLEEEKSTIELAAQRRAANPKYRAAHGCMVKVGRDGRIAVEVGYKNPPSTKKAGDGGTALTGRATEAVAGARKETASKKPSMANLSNALNQRLSEQLTAAAVVVMARSPHVATAALVAGGMTRSEYGKRVDITVRGLAEKKSTSAFARQGGAFVAMFERVLGLTDEKAGYEVAAMAASALDFQESGGDSPMKRKETAAVVNALDPKEMLAAILKAWDAKDYFASISGKQRVMIVEEVLGAEQARVAGKLKKDKQAKWCLDNITPTGWLPPQLRPASYKATVAKAGASAKPAKVTRGGVRNSKKNRRTGSTAAH